jgi:GNAT superfamily N-acetyltransferase
MNMDLVLRGITDPTEMAELWPLVVQLTPDLSLVEYRRLLAEMVKRDYAMVTAHSGSECVGLSGYWIGHKLYSGKYLEIDNFVVDKAHRSKGIGELLLNWLIGTARSEGCRMVMLDAYVENFNAHRFYYRHGFHARGHHYLKHI